MFFISLVDLRNLFVGVEKYKLVLLLLSNWGMNMCRVFTIEIWEGAIVGIGAIVTVGIKIMTGLVKFSKFEGV